jgi:phosphoribosylformylglycinamidine synthase
LDLAAERALQNLMVELIDAGLIRSAHDCADGGIAVALAECCFGGSGLGLEVSIESTNVARDLRVKDAAALFGESASRVVVSVSPDEIARVLERAAARGVPAKVIGQTGGNLLRMSVGGRIVVDLPVTEAEQAWSAAIGRYFEKRVA